MASWAPLFRPDAVNGLAFVVATSAPDLDDHDLATLGKLGAWICAFDDFFDDSEVSNDEITLRIAQYEQLISVGYCPELEFDPVARMLGEVLEELSEAPLGRSLWPLFSTQLLASCEAMRWERTAALEQARGLQTPLDVYLHHATDSICVAFVVTAAAMLIGETGTLSQVSALLAAERHCATAVRISNDLATWSREKTEASAANAFLFAGTGGSDHLRIRTSAELHSLSRALEKVRPAAPLTASFIRRFTNCFIALYRRGDLSDVDLQR